MEGAQVFFEEISVFACDHIKVRLRNTLDVLYLFVPLQEDVEPYFKAYRRFTKLVDESPIKVWKRLVIACLGKLPDYESCVTAWSLINEGCVTAWSLINKGCVPAWSRI